MENETIGKAAASATPKEGAVVPIPEAATAGSASISKTGAELAKKELPTIADLKPAEKAPQNIPSKLKLEDIPLSAYMKGGAAPSSAMRSLREIGERPTPGTEKKIVAVATDKRTEIDERGLPRIRTYASDMSREIKRRGTTLSTIVGAERERVAAGRAPAIKERTELGQRRLVLIVAAGVLLVVSIAVITAALVFLGNQEGETGAITTLSFIRENKSAVVEVGVDSPPLTRLLADAKEKAPLSLGEIERLIPVGPSTALGPGEVLTLLSAPPELARNATNVIVGIHAFNRNQPFLIIRVAYYDLAFEAMLTWEATLGESLGAFFAPVNGTGKPPRLTFADEIFKNIDLRKSEPHWPILYAFPERTLLVITTNEQTLTEILSRLSISTAR